jgi:hypothetical protein
MIMNKFTPGPWEVVREEDAYAGEFEGASLPFVTNIGPFHIEWHDDLNANNADRIEADIALMAAAPDLLEALQRLLKGEDDEYLTPQGLRNLARAAIAKATGV